MRIKRFYQAMLCLACVSIGISILLVNIYVTSNNLITNELNEVVVNIGSQHNTVLSAIANIPRAIMVLNIILFIIIYFVKKQTKQKAFKLSILWIASSIIYDVLMFVSVLDSVDFGYITMVFMVVSWVSKVLTIVALNKELSNKVII